MTTMMLYSDLEWLQGLLLTPTGLLRYMLHLTLLEEALVITFTSATGRGTDATSRSKHAAFGVRLECLTFELGLAYFWPKQAKLRQANQQRQRCEWACFPLGLRSEFQRP